MKRVSTILTALLLSLTIVVANGGVVVVHCAHSGTSHLALLLSLGDEPQQACDMESGCMSADVVQLSPTDVAQQTVYNFCVLQPLFSPALPAIWLSSFVPPRGVASSDLLRGAIRWGPPPRLYLSKLCTLII